MFYTNPAHDIHHTGNLLFPDIISYYKLENGKQGGFRGKYNHIFDSTAAYGDTVFWKYNTDFMRAEGNWNGSTAGENPISPNDIPIEIKRLSEGEL